MVSRRRSFNVLSGMRLGDLAAAVDSRQLDRMAEREDSQREAMRFRAANQALNQVIGGVGAAMGAHEASKEREFQRGRQAKADARAEELHGFNVGALEDGAESRAKQKALAALEEGTADFEIGAGQGREAAEAALFSELRADERLGGLDDAVIRGKLRNLSDMQLAEARGEGAQRLQTTSINRQELADDAAHGVYEEDLGVRLPPEMGDARVVEDLVGRMKGEMESLGVPAGTFSDSELEALARDQLGATKQGVAAQQAAAAKAADAAVDTDLKRKLTQSQINKNNRTGRGAGGGSGGRGGPGKMTVAQQLSVASKELSAAEQRARSIQNEVDDLQTRAMTALANPSLGDDEKKALEANIAARVEQKQQELAGLGDSIDRYREIVGRVARGENVYADDLALAEMAAAQAAAQQQVEPATSPEDMAAAEAALEELQAKDPQGAGQVLARMAALEAEGVQGVEALSRAMKEYGATAEQARVDAAMKQREGRIERQRLDHEKPLEMAGSAQLFEGTSPRIKKLRELLAGIAPQKLGE